MDEMTPDLLQGLISPETITKHNDSVEGRKLPQKRQRVFGAAHLHPEGRMRTEESIVCQRRVNLTGGSAHRTSCYLYVCHHIDLCQGGLNFA